MFGHFIGSAACKQGKGKVVKTKAKNFKKKGIKAKVRQVDSDLTSTDTSEEEGDSDSVGRVIEEVAVAKSGQADQSPKVRVDIRPRSGGSAKHVTWLADSGCRNIIIV